MNWRVRGLSALLIVLSVSAVSSQEKGEDQKETRSAARLEFMRNAVSKMEIVRTDSADKRDLTLKPQPLLRYSDPARGIADSAVWRIGTKGRPIALVISEVYRPMDNKAYRMSHEFLAIDKPHLTMRCGTYKWQPPEMTSLKFQTIKSDQQPAEKPTLRLNQMKRLAEKFTLREFYENNTIELRILPTPLDRYEPSDRPRADGAIFAGVWGVNPEILLFLETDGTSWSYAFMRSGAAKLWAILDDVEVWSVPSVFVTPASEYSLAPNPIDVPAAIFQADSEKQTTAEK